MATGKTEVIRCRISPADKAEIVRRAESQGVKVSEYMRLSALGTKPAAESPTSGPPHSAAVLQQRVKQLRRSMGPKAAEITARKELGL